MSGDIFGQPVIGTAFGDGSAVVIAGLAQAQRLHENRLGGGSVPESDARLRPKYSISAILTPEEANLALNKGWLKLKSPSTLIQRPLIQQVFEDLWSRSMWVTSGMKFGADMLAYQQTPGVVHSSYIVLVREFDQRLDVLDLITVGRLATSVNKKAVIADVDQSSGNVRYATLEWDQIASNPPRDVLTLNELDEAINRI